eukprot:GHVR01029446.1.p1 GENE.GHVR01029446.1~~GHVR01029446.1.p1  ORF type:complete len:165 (-),score=17.08 GHVR01029446.1:32-526(-)
MKFQKTSITEKNLFGQIKNTHLAEGKCTDNDIEVIKAGMYAGLVPNLSNAAELREVIPRSYIVDFWNGGCISIIAVVNINVWFLDNSKETIKLKGPLINKKVNFSSYTVKDDPWNFILESDAWLHASIGTRLIQGDTIHDYQSRKEFLYFYSRLSNYDIIIRGT